MTRLTAEALVVLGRGPYDFSLEAGECTSLRGPSGVGKTLLLRALADLDRHEGIVRMDGVIAEEMTGPEWRRQVGLLFAESAWWASSVRDHFPETAPAPIPLDELGLSEDTLDYEVSRLSTGERQRLAIARLLAGAPKVLLLDEPTASLDEANVARVEALITSYRSEREASVLWVTHDPGQTERVATRHFELSQSGLKEISP